MSEAITQTSPRATHEITSTPYSHATFPLSVPPTNQNIKSYDTHAIYAEHLTSRRTRLTFHRQFREAHTPSGQRTCQSRRCQYPPSQRVRYAPYQQYKHSIPSERSESHRRSYFKALPEKDLSDHDMLYGVSREVARCQLEVFVLLMLFDGQLQWQSKWGSWFWQSPNDKDLVILRQWVEPRQEQERPSESH